LLPVQNKICEIDSIQIDATISTGTSYNWDDGITTPSRIIKAKGLYTVSISDGVCTIKDSTLLEHDTMPAPYIGPDSIICQNDKVVLNTNITGADLTSWKFNNSTIEQNTDSIEVNDPGEYQLEVTTGLCKAADTMQIITKVVPVFSLGTDTVVLCNGEVLNLGTNLPYNHYWNTDSTNDSIFPTSEGKYSLVLTNGPCTYTDSIYAKFLPFPTVNIGPNISKCIGESHTLSGPAGTYQYKWNGVIGSQTKTINTTGTYILTVSNGHCAISDAMDAIFTTPVNPDLPPNTTVCLGTPVSLDATVPSAGAIYNWNTEETASSINPTNTGYYEVTIIEGGCTNTYNANVTIHQPVSFDLGPNINVCPYEKIKVGINLDSLTVTWSNYATTDSILIEQPGTYTVTVVDGPCTVSDNIVVNHYSLPYLQEKRYVLCPEDSVILDIGSNSFSSIQWSNGSTQQTILGLPGNNYFVNVSSADGCINSFYFGVEEDLDCPDIFYIPNAFSPNQNNINEVYKPVLTNVSLMYFRIFNRWGELVYETTEEGTGWNGIYLGALVQNGVYVWEIKYKDRYNFKGIRKGHVNVLR
jgi:gliding motility-associated-like protein